MVKNATMDEMKRGDIGLMGLAGIFNNLIFHIPIM